MLLSKLISSCVLPLLDDLIFLYVLPGFALFTTLLVSYYGPDLLRNLLLSKGSSFTFLVNPLKNDALAFAVLTLIFLLAKYLFVYDRHPVFAATNALLFLFLFFLSLWAAYELFKKYQTSYPIRFFLGLITLFSAQLVILVSTFLQIRTGCEEVLKLVGQFVGSAVVVMITVGLIYLTYIQTQTKNQTQTQDQDKDKDKDQSQTSKPASDLRIDLLSVALVFLGQLALAFFWLVLPALSCVTQS